MPKKPHSKRKTKVAKPPKKTIKKKPIKKIAKPKRPIAKTKKVRVRAKARPAPKQIQLPVLTEEIRPEPQKPEAKTPAIPAGPLIPALELLPEWVDGARLSEFLAEEGIALACCAKDSHDFTAATSFLSGARKADQKLPGYFLICAKDKNAKLLGAIDGYALGSTLLVMRSRATVKRRELHMLLHCAALTAFRPAYVLFTTPHTPFSPAEAGRMILLGRGLGMAAIAASHPSLMFFLRRPGKEFDPMTTGQEISMLLSQLSGILNGQLAKVIAEFQGKGALALVLLPNSPDSREHLHELKDAVLMLGMPADHLDPVLDELKVEYISERKDITPEYL